MSDHRSTATRLVAIAEELYTFGCVTEGRRRGGDPEPVLHTFASPKGNPEVKRPLVDIRPDLAEVFEVTYGRVPGASALADAMTVLEGKARAAAPTEADEDTLAALLPGGGSSSIATRLVKLAREHHRLGVTTTGEAFAVPVNGPNVARVLRGGRRSLRAELARLYYEKNGSAANAAALADALLVLEGEAQGVEPTEAALRVGRCPTTGRLVLDLGGEDGRVAVVGVNGWEVLGLSPVLFWRTNATLPLPAPADEGTLDPLRRLLNLPDEDWPLLVAWLLAALIPELPHPVLLLRGEHGTAKSSAARLLTSLLDRCASQLRTAPRNVEDWAVAAAGSWVTCLDNVSDLQPWLQDAICRAVTGDGLLRRALYTDADVSVLAFRRVVAITSVDPGRIAGDLADRLLTVELERITEKGRRADEDLNAAWAKEHPVVLAGLLSVAVDVLRVLPTVRRSGLPRMADFARVLLAVDEVLDTNGYRSYAEQAGRTAEQVAEGDSVSVAVREHITAPWEGTVSELLGQLTAERPPKDWPATPQGLGGRLVRAAPALRSLGWTVEKLPRADKKGTRRWSIVPPSEPKELAAKLSGMSASSVTPPEQAKHADNGTDESLFDGLRGGQVVSGPASATDNLTRWTDNPADEDGHHISASQPLTDNTDDPASPTSVCSRCQQPSPFSLINGRCRRCAYPSGAAP